VQGFLWIYLEFWFDLGLESFAKRVLSPYTIKPKVFSPSPLSFILFMWDLNLITIQISFLYYINMNINIQQIMITNIIKLTNV
jgi:hypothetical protein